MEDQFVVGIPLRDFGCTGVKVSALACGHHLGDPDEESVARQIVNRVIDRGITFFDNWEYHKGKCEEWLGSALKGKPRSIVQWTGRLSSRHDPGPADGRPRRQ